MLNSPDVCCIASAQTLAKVRAVYHFSGNALLRIQFCRRGIRPVTQWTVCVAALTQSCQAATVAVGLVVVICPVGEHGFACIPDSGETANMIWNGETHEQPGTIEPLQ